MTTLEKLKKVNLLFNNTLLTIAGVTLVLSMSLIVLNGFMRIFTTPFGAVVELVSWGAAIVTAFSLGSTQITKGHVFIDLLFNRLPKMLQKIVAILTTVLVIVFFIIVINQLFKYGLTLKTNGTLSTTLGIPFYPIILMMSFGFLGLLTTLLIDLLEVFSKKGEIEWVQEQSL